MMDHRQINKMIENLNDESKNKISDSFHTFEELYDHRLALFVALCNKYIKGSWKSKLHHDGTMYDGWFIAGINTIPGQQISYHLPLSWWDAFKWAEELKKAPEWDGHTPQDVIERLKGL